METQQTATPPSSSPCIGMTIHSPMSQAKSIVNSFNPSSNLSTLKKSEKAKQTARSPSSQLHHSFQIKLIDLCTEYQGTYFKCEDLADFWAEIAHSLGPEFPFPITGNHVEGWVEGICRETKEYLLRREIFPHRADREDLDIAIEDWLEIEGRRRFQRGFTDMITGYLLAYGPEESEEENLLTYSCLSRLRENTDRVKTAVSEKGEASRKNGMLLIQKVEFLGSKLDSNSTQQLLTPEEIYGRVTNRPHENMFPYLNPNVAAPSDPPLWDHTKTDSEMIGASGTTEDIDEGLPNILSKPSDGLDDNQSPAIIFSAEKLPRVSIHPNSPHKNEVQQNKTAEGHSLSPISPAEESPSSTDQDPMYQAPKEHELECINRQNPNVQLGRTLTPCSSAVKKSALDLSSAEKPEKSKRIKVQNGKGVDRSRRLSRRDINISDAEPSVPTLSLVQDSVAVDFSQNAQSQQQAETSGELTRNTHRAGQEYADALAATPSTVTQKARKKKRAGKKQTLTNKRHLKKGNMTDQSSTTAKRSSDSITWDSNNLGGQRSQVISADMDPTQNPFGDVPIIDLTQSPDQEIVKRERGWAAEGLEGRLNRLTASLNGTVGLTPEKIKEIVDRSVSLKLNDAAHHVVEKLDRTLEKRLDQLRRDWRPPEDRQNQ